MLKEIYHGLGKARGKRQDSFPGDTYGQVSEKGTTMLIKLFNERFADPRGVFYDLGCGPGHMVMHVALATPVRKSVGIELHKSRYDLGIETLTAMKENYKDKLLDKVHLYNEDIFKCDFSDATILYVDNTVFSKKASDMIYDKAPKGCLMISCRQFSAVDNYPPRTTMINRNYSNNGIWFTIK